MFISIYLSCSDFNSEILCYLSFQGFFLLFIVDGTMDGWVARWLRTDCGPQEKLEVTWSGRVSATRAPMSSLTWARMASLTSSMYLFVLEDAPFLSQPLSLLTISFVLHEVLVAIFTLQCKCIKDYHDLSIYSFLFQSLETIRH